MPGATMDTPDPAAQLRAMHADARATGDDPDAP